jgi:hypothetical protein
MGRETFILPTFLSMAGRKRATDSALRPHNPVDQATAREDSWIAIIASQSTATRFASISTPPDQQMNRQEVLRTACRSWRLTLLLLLASVVWCGVIAPESAAGGVEEEVSPFRTNVFRLHKANGRFYLLTGQDGKEAWIRVPTAWLVPADAAQAEEQEYVSSFNYDPRITSFAIGNGLVGLHLSSFEAMTDGSAQAAAGRDVFLIFDPRSLRLQKGLTTLGITKSRVREESCFRATAAHFVLADIDQDGLVDLGMVSEAIRCIEVSSEGEPLRPSLPHFVQQPIQWFVRQQNRWETAPSFRGQLPKDATALPLIGIELSPIDYVGYRYWKTHDAARWSVEPPASTLYQPPYRKTLVHRMTDRTDQMDKPKP